MKRCQIFLLLVKDPKFLQYVIYKQQLYPWRISYIRPVSSRQSSNIEYLCWCWAQISITTTLIKMVAQQHGNLRIGTSNIVLPGAKSTFPEEFQSKSRLYYYSTLFNSVELNSTFYKVPMSATFEKWSQDVVNDFRFTIKLWKEITHVKELMFNTADIESFLQKAALIGNKKGCLLLQFPGKITLDYFSKVEEIFEIITQSDYPNEWETAIEFRNPSWYTGETFELLDEYNSSMVLHDFPKAKNEQLNNKARVAYLRFHGPQGDYRGSYSNEFLEKKTEQITKWRENGKDVYAYFNNTAGDAFENARTLKRLNEVCNQKD